MTGRSGLSERGEERVGSARGDLGRLVSRVRPSWAPGHISFIFFLLPSFSFVLNFCFEF
jgi:hypothetical protein